MRFPPEEAGSRREFLRGVLRYGLLGMLTAAGVVAASRSARGQRCINQGICGGCAVFATCGLPQALSAKQRRKSQPSAGL